MSTFLEPHTVFVTSRTSSFPRRMIDLIRCLGIVILSVQMFISTEMASLGQFPVLKPNSLSPRNAVDRIEGSLSQVKNELEMLGASLFDNDAALSIPGRTPYNAANDIILVWNQVMLDANAADTLQAIPDQPGPCRGSRAFAIVSVAMFDAWNSIHRKYTPFLVGLKGFNSANERAAVSKAALDSLVSLYPKQAARFQTAYSSAMDSVPNGPARNRGIELGTLVANAILANRSNDNSNLNLPYTFKNHPGYHQPDPLHPNQGAYVPHWGFVDPFVIEDADEYLCPPPPALDSQEYAFAYEEVYNYGGNGITTPTHRTPEQTTIGIFWGYDGSIGLGTPPRLYNQIVRTIAIKKRNSVEANARLFALVNLAMADAGIQCWYTKYFYEFWRPVIGIQQGNADGNSNTRCDPLWLPLGAPATNGTGDGVDFTPPFPAYSSGHAAFGAAALYTVAAFYGTTRIPFSFTSDEFNGINKGSDGIARPIVTRTYRTLEDAVWENAFSRVYLGIHWSFDATAGVDSGKRIAIKVSTSALRRLRGKN